MAKSGRKRKAKVTLPGCGGQVLLVTVEVQDPYEPSKRVTVQKNAQTTPIDQIFARGRLVGPGDSHEDAIARKLAGDEFQRLYEAAESSDAKAIDYSAVKVDVSFSDRDIPERRASASREMVAISRAMTPDRYSILRAICGEQVSFYAYVQAHAVHWGAASRLEYYGLLRHALDDLIWHRGVARGAERARIRACREVACA